MQPSPLRADGVPLHARHEISTYELSRRYGTDASPPPSVPSVAEEMVDAVLHAMAKLDNVPSFVLLEDGHAMPSFTDRPIQLTDDVFCTIRALERTSEGAVSSVTLVLASDTVPASDLATYVRRVHEAYVKERHNALGNALYFFDQKSKGTPPPRLPPDPRDPAEVMAHRQMVLHSAPKALSFSMAPFRSNKRFSNVFGDDVRAIERRVRFFLDHRDWYDARGVPYQLGLLLSGIPGAGKTSVIRAIANAAKRHIVNVNFGRITTTTQLKNLFYSDTLHVLRDDGAVEEAFYVPVDRRLYVLEELDAVRSSVVRTRDDTNDANDANAPALEDELTLGDILTVLDGTMETPGRMLVMTTNMPDLLDPALIRPGRVDVHAAFGHASRALVGEMYAAYTGREMSSRALSRVPDARVSPAEVSQVIFRHFGGTGTSDIEDAVAKDLAALVVE
jgi:hypothetical protein